MDYLDECAAAHVQKFIASTESKEFKLDNVEFSAEFSAEFAEEIKAYTSEVEDTDYTVQDVVYEMTDAEWNNLAKSIAEVYSCDVDSKFIQEWIEELKRHPDSHPRPQVLH